MAVKSYEDLIAWQKAVDLVAQVYRATDDFPRREIFGLTSQMRRCAINVPSNIAEGQGRLSTGEFKQFLGHARGSIFELQTQIKIATTLGYLEEKRGQELKDGAAEVGRIIQGLLASL
jgi:four helix bundle protein